MAPQELQPLSSNKTAAPQMGPRYFPSTTGRGWHSGQTPCPLSHGCHSANLLDSLGVSKSARGPELTVLKIATMQDPNDSEKIPGSQRPRIISGYLWRICSPEPRGPEVP